jgi:hypothetical protein
MSDGKKQSSIKLEGLRERESKVSLLKIEDNALTIDNSIEGASLS